MEGTFSYCRTRRMNPEECENCSNNNKTGEEPEPLASSSPPDKARKTCKGHSIRGSDNDDENNKTDTKNNVKKPSQVPHDPLLLSKYKYVGICPSEFLPLELYRYDPTVIQEQQQQSQRSLRLDEVMNQLTDDVLGKCLFGGFLDSLETYRLLRVSKRIRRMASQQVQTLDLSRCHKVSQEDIQSIVRNLPNLQELDFSYCAQFGAEELKELAPLSKTLTHLVLKGTKVNDQAIQDFLLKTKSHHSTGSSRLEHLDLSAVEKENSTLIGDSAVQAIATHCPSLKCLRLAWCRNVTDTGTQYLTCLSKLVDLDLSLTGITTVSSSHLHQMSHQLEILDLSATNISTQNLVQKVFAVPSALSSSSMMTMMPSCPRLSMLRLRFHSDLTGVELKNILLQSPSLKVLDVSYCGTEGMVHMDQKLALQICQRKIRLLGTIALVLPNHKKDKDQNYKYEQQ